MSVRLSKVSKLDGIRSWSLNASDSCIASRENGEYVDACKICYARQGRYPMKNVRSIRDHNQSDWLRTEWVDEMVRALDNDRWFRWFDSGDLMSPGLAEKIYQVCLRTPWCSHWLPTRTYKLRVFRAVLDKLNGLDNVMVRFSSDSVHGEFDSHHGSTIIPMEDVEQFAGKVVVCRAYERKGQCQGCRACWNKQIKVIAYPAHGRASRVFYRAN